MPDNNFDILIIGSGPGGYVAAIRAAQLGFRTAIVERDYLGGICLNWGCIPTKALLRSAEIYHYLSHAKDYGLSAERVSFDPKAVVGRSRVVAKRLNDGVGFLMRKNKVQVIWGQAAIDAPGKITVKSNGAPPKGTLGPGSYGAQHIIVATGARPRVLPGIEPDKKLIWTYFEAMVPTSCRNRCWSSVPAPSVSNLRRSSAPWVLTSLSLRCCHRFCQPRTPKSPRFAARRWRSKASKFSPAPK